MVRIQHDMDISLGLDSQVGETKINRDKNRRD